MAHSESVFKAPEADAPARPRKLASLSWLMIRSPRSIRAFVTAGFIVSLASMMWADELTPSGEPRDEAITSFVEFAKPIPPVNFDQTVKKLKTVYPIHLNDFSQVAQNSYNWQGQQDASMECDIGFTNDAILVRGNFRDDIPFYQTLKHPAMQDWWRITYGADGIEFQFENPTSATQRAVFVLNFGSQAVEPCVELLATPKGPALRRIESAFLRLQDAAQSSVNGGQNEKYHFDAAVPMAALEDIRLFDGALRITVRLHDLDGDPATYLMMQQTIEKRK
ncbi:MAG: hypothetical protein NTY46_09710 [Candidatus Sumerlaeota bacterium]|nr:hypothetical protein [Candidatus Sumerlaeota bacterium]